MGIALFGGVMIKRVLLWAKTTDIWIVLAQIYTVFLCLFMIKNGLYGLAESDKYVGLAAFVLLMILSFRYSLYKRFVWWVFAVFFVMTYISGFVEGFGIMRTFGSSVHRNWYIYLLAMVVARTLKEQKKMRWLIILFSVQTTALAIVFIISVISATKKLFNSDYQVFHRFGSFVSGRLSTFSSSNTAGPAAAILILLSVILIYLLKGFRFRILTNVFLGIYIVIGWIALGLSRSRGAIIATSIGLGVFFFTIIYDRIKTYKIKAFFAASAVCAGVALVSLGICLVPKPVFDVCVTTYAEKMRPDLADLVKEKMEVADVTHGLTTLTDRTQIWTATINMLDEKPRRWVIGITPQKIPETYVLDIYEGRPEITIMSVHNGYLEQLFIYGIPGATITALLLCIWMVRIVICVLWQKTTTQDKILASLPALAVVNAMVEAFLFPFYVIYPISFYFFVGEGCLEGTMEKKEKSIKVRIIIALCVILGISAVGYITYHAYTESDKKYRYVADYEAEPQDPNDFVRLNTNIKSEMMSADYWINLRNTGEAKASGERLSLAEIDRLNYLNRRMITTATTSFSLYDVGDLFYYKVAKTFVEDTMKTVNAPEKFLLNGVPTDKEYWESLEEKANIEAIDSRISVKFGVSVCNSVLRRYPTDDKIYSVDSNLYYDEIAQSDLLPFMPVAVLHESADGEWYYVLTYGYGGWIRKECIALYETKDEWLSFAEAKDFIIVTGKELRLPTDPYEQELSGMLVPMGTKLPVVALKDAPEDIHNRIGFGNYIAKLPKRNQDGMVEDVYVLIPASEDVNLGYLPFTEENVAKLAFKHLGAGYGWAGDNNGQDCSGYVREIYGCFGYNMPRSAKAQADMECTASYDVVKKSADDIMEILKDAPIGTLLYFPGHIMLYLGNENGVAYCISSVGNFARIQDNVAVQREVNTVVITDMNDTVRADGIPWISSLTKIVIP